MRLSIGRAVVIGFALAAAALPAEPQQFGSRVSHWGQMWGTWAWRTNKLSPAVVTFHIDGTAIVSDASMFGGLFPNSPIRVTPMQGVWERTGWQTAGGTVLYLIFDSSTGVVRGWGRARSSIQFADDFNSFQGKMFVESLPCTAPASPGMPVSCPDPLDPTASWVPNSNLPKDGYDISAARLERVPAGPLQ